MDDLEFRRRLYADPADDDIAILEAIQSDANRAKFAEELKHIDAVLDSTLKVDVPEGLAERLLLRQTMDVHQRQKKTMRSYMALAASVAFIAGVSLTMLRTPDAQLSQHVLAHVYHEIDTVVGDVDEQVALNQVNAKLASYGAQMSNVSEHIYYANHCDFDGKRSLHMVIGGEQGKVTVFLVPNVHSFEQLPASFADERFNGIMQTRGDVGIITVAEHKEDAKRAQQQLQETLRWQSI